MGEKEATAMRGEDGLYVGERGSMSARTADGRMAEFEMNDASTMPSLDPSSSLLLLTMARPLISRLHREAVDRSLLCMLLTFCTAMLCFACLAYPQHSCTTLVEGVSLIGPPFSDARSLPSVCLRLDGDGSFRRIWSSGSGRSPFVYPPARLVLPPLP